MTDFKPGDRITWNYGPPDARDPIVPTPGVVMETDGPFITIEVSDGRGGRRQQVIHETWLERRDEACESLGEMELTVSRLYKEDAQ
jgi:hypothetical protein